MNTHTKLDSKVVWDCWKRPIDSETQNFHAIRTYPCIWAIDQAFSSFKVGSDFEHQGTIKTVSESCMNRNSIPKILLSNSFPDYGRDLITRFYFNDHLNVEYCTTKEGSDQKCHWPKQLDLWLMRVEDLGTCFSDTSVDGCKCWWLSHDGCGVNDMAVVVVSRPPPHRDNLGPSNVLKSIHFTYNLWTACWKATPAIMVDIGFGEKSWPTPTHSLLRTNDGRRATWSNLLPSTHVGLVLTYTDQVPYQWLMTSTDQCVRRNVQWIHEIGSD